MTSRDRRALVMLAVAVPVILFFTFRGDSEPKVVAADNSPALAEKRLAHLREIAASVPGKEAVLKQVNGDLALRERGVITAATAAQAQAALLDAAARVGKAEGIDVRGGDFGSPRQLSDYGEVSASITFNCPIEKLINFLAALTHEEQLITPAGLHVAAGNTKEKTVAVRMTLTGIVPRKLVPEKKVLF